MLMVLQRLVESLRALWVVLRRGFLILGFSAVWFGSTAFVDVGSDDEGAALGVAVEDS